MQDTADDAAIIDPARAWLVLRKVRLDRRPRLVVQPEKPARPRLRRKTTPGNLICGMASMQYPLGSAAGYHPRRHTSTMTQVLQTDRIVLRRFVESDLDDLCRLYADQEVRRFFPQVFLSRAEAEEELAWSIHGSDDLHPNLRLYAAIDRRTGSFIGRGGFVRWEFDGTVEVEIAYMIDKDLWRRGMGSELAHALLCYGFSTLPVQHLIAVIDASNTASIKTAEKIGMSRRRSIFHAERECSVFAVSATDHKPST
jgi:ribosomal-protein-alanine N-acetyltransferase